MPPALTAACLWAALACALALLPSRRHHWPLAWALIATGVPLLVWVTWTVGAGAGLACLAAGASILRWPLRYGVQALRRWAGLSPDRPVPREADPAE